MKKWISVPLCLVLTCLFPCFFMFCQNAGEANFKDIFPFFLVFLATAAVIFLVCLVIFRNLSRAGFFTAICILVVINFSLLSDFVADILPWFRAKLVFLVICLLLLGLMVLLLRKKPNMNVGCILISLAFGAMILMNFIMAVPQLIMVASYKMEPSEEHPQAPPGQETAFAGEKRNVYYLFFDEYGGDENLWTYFDFDNSEFYGELEQRGFTVSHSSYNTESCWTDTLVPNLLNLNYVANDQMPESTRRSYLEHPYLFRLFQDNGYQVNIINHRAYLKTAGATELTKGQLEDNISKYLLENSIFQKIDPLKEQLDYWLFVSYRDNYNQPLEDALSRLKDCHTYAQDGPTLTVSYIQSPHAPFIYRADGTSPDKDHLWYWRDETLYPGQLQYLNGQILEAIDNIQAADPDAVILLLSDHGARVPLHMVEQFGGPRFDAVKETPVMQSTLCAVCVPGQTVDIEGATGINATRRTINAAFGTDLPDIPAAEGYVLDERYNAPAE